MGNSIRRYGVWISIALIGAICWGVLALSRGETVNAGWLLFAALASYAIAYRFYARFIQKKVLETDDSRATPAERLNNGRDFEPTDRRALLGDHVPARAEGGPEPGRRGPAARRAAQHGEGLGADGAAGALRAPLRGQRGGGAARRACA